MTLHNRHFDLFCGRYTQVFASRIRFFVFRNTKISHPSFFTTKYDLKLRLRTKWCSSSIVHATIKSLQAVLEGDTSVGMIYIVSGYDIPIQPPSALFTTRSVITEGVFKNVVPFRSVIAFTPGEDMDLKGMEPEGNDFAIFMVTESESFLLDFIAHKPYILTYRSLWVGQTE